ncbi:MAG TPA: hypothetical protein VF519_12370 [Mycobacteriales bacterium]|jgi:hypothetical protein
MRRTALAAALLAAAASFAAAPSASACVGLPCDVVNAVCEITRGAPCVR